MKRITHLTIVALIAFAVGFLTQTKLDARPVTSQTILETEDSPEIVMRGSASWYSKRSPGIRKRTANNEIFDDRAFTCAMWGVKFHQKIRVTNLKNNKSVVVRVNDRGPHRRFYRKGRIVDLSKRAFEEIAPLKKGLIKVKVEFL